MFWDKIKALTGAKIDNSGISVLVIEDNQVDQKITCAALKRGGYSTLQAFDGKSGLEMAERLQPNLIILDYNLSDSKGPDICKVLKVTEKTRDIPVLFLTGMDSPGSILDCYEQGGENYLSKPINPKFLLKQIDQALNDKRKTEN